MLDKSVSALYKKYIINLAYLCIKNNISANTITISGFAMGALAFVAIIYNHYYLAIIFVILNRLCDGLDGLVATLTKPTEGGAFLDIVLDFAFYSSIPLGFAINNPTDNALAGAVLIYSFLLTGTSFLASAIFAEKNHITNNYYTNKAFYYSLGLIEATETTLFFIVILLLPQYFAILSIIFALLCVLTFLLRVSNVYRVLRHK
jgi:phosphatidylglycerophosphate synthase